MTELTDIANGFNNFFAGIGPELADKIPPSDLSFKTFLGQPEPDNFQFSILSPSMLIKICGILKPKTSCGPDFMSTKLLKKIIYIIQIPLCHLFNLSLNTGYIPQEFKTAKCIPIFKSGKKEDFNNYRPISLLSSFSKLFEKIVAKQINYFLNHRDILYMHQYGFRKGHNTSHPVMHFLDKIYSSLNKDTPDFTLGIFIDLKKSFDTVDHEILLQKMEHYGFRGTSNLWFKNYLTGRTQFVNINGTNSNLREMTCGVPQGSVLGPLLFLLFINDMPLATELFTLLFADDTTYQLSGNNLSELYANANIELEKAATWFKSNKLTLNVKKTKYILFRSKNMDVDWTNLNLKLGSELVDRIGNGCKENSFKFVGHYLDEFISWDQHLKHVISKLASADYAIGRTKNFLPLKIRKTIYNSLFRSHAEFGILAWGCSPESKLKKIFTLQKKCMRNVANVGYRFQPV